MKKIKLLRTAFMVLAVAGLMLFSLTACVTENTTTNTTPAATATTVTGTETEAVIDVYEDLLKAHAAVFNHLTYLGTTWDQIMLADDVPSPEMKYGLLVVPFIPSELTARHTRTVDISRGNFVIKITSAQTGLVWSINPNKTIVQVGNG